MLFDQTDPPRFWDRTTFLFAASGLFAYLVSLWLFQIPSAVVLVLVNFVRLLPGLALARIFARRLDPWHAGALALPYPLELAVWAYSKRLKLLPDSLIPALSGPTAFLIFVTCIVLASRWATVWALPERVRQREANSLRFLGNLLLVLTAIGVVLVPSPWSLFFLHYVPEPIALIGYCALAGRSLTSYRRSFAGSRPLTFL